jgi:hypothetical protein
LTADLEEFDSDGATLIQSGGSHAAGAIEFLRAGTVSVSGGSLSIGYVFGAARGTLNISGGSVSAQVLSSLTFVGTIALSGGGALSSYELDLPNWSQLQFSGGTLTLTGSATNAGNLSIGSNGGSAVFNQSGGSSLVSVGGDLLLAASGTSTSATYNLSGPGLLTVNGNEYVGYAGSGVFNQIAGTHTISGTLYVGFATGTVSGSTFNLVGGSLLAGSIVVNAGGRFNGLVGSLTLASLDVQAGGTFAASTTIPASQPLLVNAGTLMAQGGNLVINVPNLSNSGMLANAVGSNLFINASSVTNTGSITVDAQGSVVFAVPVSNVAGQGITLAGGALAAPRIVNNGTVTGFGQITGDLVNNALAGSPPPSWMAPAAPRASPSPAPAPGC